MSINSNLAFGPRLRAHRERRGITLAALAASIKIKESLLNQLERDDVSRWPPGIYGRALVREYAKSVGLPADEIVQQFVELFAGAEQQRDTARSGPEREDAATTSDLRLTFAPGPTRRPESLSSRLVAAAIELVLVLTTGCLVTLVSPLPVWTATALVALSWYPARAVFCGHDAFYRILRLRRLSTSSVWSQTTEITPIANLMSMGRTVVGREVDPAEDSFIVDPDVNTGTSSPASFH